MDVGFSTVMDVPNVMTFRFLAFCKGLVLSVLSKGPFERWEHPVLGRIGKFETN
jgi:hypothetical protein